MSSRRLVRKRFVAGTRRAAETGEHAGSNKTLISLIAVPVIVVALGAWLTDLPSRIAAYFNPAPTISATVTVPGKCGYRLMVPGNADNLNPPPLGSDEVVEWAFAHEGAQSETYPGPDGGGMGTVLLTVTGYGQRPVTITSVDFVVEKRSDPLVGGLQLVRECLDPTVFRYAEVDLDQSPPRIDEPSAIAAEGLLEQMRSEPVEFPYEVTSENTETFLLIAHTRGYVEWKLRLNWSDGENSGSLILDNEGSPLRITAPA